MRQLGMSNSAKALYQEALKIWRAEKNFIFPGRHLEQSGSSYITRLVNTNLLQKPMRMVLCVHVAAITERAESLILTGLGDLYSEIEEFEAAAQAYEQAETIASGFYFQLSGIGACKSGIAAG